MPSRKYGNQKSVVDGIKFDSQKEARYYQELKLLKRAGEIEDFELQPEFVLLPGFKTGDGAKIREIKYRADFKIIHKDGTIEVVDVKGYKTEVYKLKKKLFLYRFPWVRFREV